MKNTRLVYSTAIGDQRKSGVGGKADSAGGAGADAKKQPSSPDGKQVTVRLDTKSRRGKAVTVISNIPHNPQVIEDLAKQLKALCGAGGTVEGRDILVQGDHRDKIVEKLAALGYKSKRL